MRGAYVWEFLHAMKKTRIISALAVIAIDDLGFLEPELR